MKDSKGHGSNGRGGNRPLQGHPYHAKTGAELRYIVKDASAAAKAMQGHSPQSESKYLDQANDAHTVLGYRNRNGLTDDGAKAELHSGTPKSNPVPVNPGTEDRPGYSAHAVNNAIASSNRSGRRIGGKEAKAIHALLRGRH